MMEDGTVWKGMGRRTRHRKFDLRDGDEGRGSWAYKTELAGNEHMRDMGNMLKKKRIDENVNVAGDARRCRGDARGCKLCTACRRGRCVCSSTLSFLSSSCDAPFRFHCVRSEEWREGATSTLMAFLPRKREGTKMQLQLKSLCLRERLRYHRRTWPLRFSKTLVHRGGLDVADQTILGDRRRALWLAGCKVHENPREACISRIIHHSHTQLSAAGGGGGGCPVYVSSCRDAVIRGVCNRM